jgi:hypothetical protein
MGFSNLVRGAFSDARLGGDFGVIAMVRVLIGLLLLGGRRLDHLRYLATDPLLRRFARVRVWPTARTASRWLKRFTMKSVEHLAALNAAVIAQIIPRLQLRTLTVDVDGVVVSTGLQVERARRGYNPHHRKVPSYYPITAHLAETTHVLRVRNRSGNVHDSRGSVGFLRELWEQLTAFSLPSRQIRFRMDGAFFQPDVLKWLAWREVGYAIKVPFFHWLDLQQFIRSAPRCQIAKSSLGFPATVTRPGFVRCLNWRWLPRVPTRYQPSSCGRRRTSETFIGRQLSQDVIHTLRLLL